MFKVNDVVIYGAQGVCEITAIEEKSVSGVTKAYFVLKPIQDQGSTIYAPTDNAFVLKKMRRLLTVSQINNLIDSMPNENTVWIDNMNERKECYKNLLASYDHSALIQMLKSIYAHKKEREAAGKRLHTMDENFFKEAERILYNEFQYVLQLSGKDAFYNFILDDFITSGKSMCRVAVKDAEKFYKDGYGTKLMPEHYENFVIISMEKMENLDCVVKESIRKVRKVN